MTKFFTKTQKISKPVICVGNLIAGGSGKTPTAIAVGKILHEIGINFAFLSRGYMRDGSTFLMLDKADYSKAEIVGDEPLLLLETAPTFVSTDRLFGAKQIEKMNKFSAILLDDGMQNNSLHRDFTIMVVDGKVGFGNNFLIPAGPMREPASSGLKKADLVVVIGTASKKLLKKLEGKTIVAAKIVSTNLSQFFGKKLIAFCGLAFPQKFFSFLVEHELEVSETHSFADHHAYTIPELQNLEKIAAEKNAVLIATKKDWIKFPKIFQEKISYLDIELEFEDRETVKNLLKKIS